MKTYEELFEANNFAHNFRKYQATFKKLYQHLDTIEGRWDGDTPRGEDAAMMAQEAKNTLKELREILKDLEGEEEIY